MADISLTCQQMTCFDMLAWYPCQQLFVWCCRHVGQHVCNTLVQQTHVCCFDPCFDMPTSNFPSKGSHCPSQVPKRFQIVPLPSKIISWRTSLLLWLPVEPQLVEAHARMALGCGIAMSTTVTELDSGAITSSTEWPYSIELKSLELLLWLCVKGSFCKRVIVHWLKTQSQMPSMLWLRPSGKMDKKIPTRMQSATLAGLTMATEIVQKERAQRETAKSLTHLCPPPHPLLTWVHPVWDSILRYRTKNYVCSVHKQSTLNTRLII